MIGRELLVIFTCPKRGIFIDLVSADGWCQYPPRIWHVGDSTSDVRVNKRHPAPAGWRSRSGHCGPTYDVCLSQGQCLVISYKGDSQHALARLTSNLGGDELYCVFSFKRVVSSVNIPSISVDDCIHRLGMEHRLKPFSVVGWGVASH